MTQSNVGYAVEQFRDPKDEIRRLERQAAMVAEAEEAAFAALGFPDAGEVLDVGCGPGFVAARLGARRPALRITGVDRDPVVLAEAERRIATVRGDADDLPLPDASFDAAYTRVVLRHLSDPAAAVAEMARVVKPGGLVLLADSDDGTIALDPVPAGFERVLAARHESFRRRGADPHMGRRLVGLLAGAGLTDVRVRTLVVGTDSLGPAAFAAIMLAPLLDAVDEDLSTPEEVALAAEAARRWADSPGAFGMMTAVLASARRPTAT